MFNTKIKCEAPHDPKIQSLMNENAALMKNYQKLEIKNKEL